MRVICWSITCMLVLSLSAGVLQAETVAWWRFEEGVAGGCAEKGFVITDSSGNGNHLDPFEANCTATGYSYSDNVMWSQVPLTGDENSLCWRTSGDWPSSTTNSAITNPSGIDVEAITPLAWTVEATIKVEQYAPTWRTFVGRDSFGLSGNAMESSFYLQVNNQNTPGIRFIDLSGRAYLLNGPTGYIQGFNAIDDPLGENVPWYHMAAVSDGDTLSLWIAEDGGNYQLMGRMALPSTGDTSLSAGHFTRPPHGHEWHGGAWTVGRGLWDSFHNDRGRGFIDEVRISDEALEVHELLGYHRSAARNPYPADLGVEVMPEVTFAWDAPADPADAGQVNPQVEKYQLYLQTSVTDPTWAAPIDVVPTGLRQTYGPVALEADLAGYRWRVDTVLNDDPTDPNTIAGPEWTFDTMPTLPLIKSQPSPRYQVVEVGDSVAITIEVASLTPVTYAWKQIDASGVESAVGTDSPVLEIASVAGDTHYYCELTNTDGTVVSNRASVGTGRNVAHWAIGEVEPGGQWPDLSGEGHPADPNGAPSYIAGVDGTAGGAVEIDPENGWALAGNWNPSEYTGQLTVSFWMLWGGRDSTWQTFVAKRDGGFNSTEALWQVSSNFDQDDLWFEAPGYRVWRNDILQVNAWQHIVATFDGTTGRLYFNGQLAATSNMRFGNAVDTVITIGADSGDLQSVRDFTNGALDDVRLYSYALTDVEVARLYNDVTDESVCVQSELGSPQYDLDGNCVINLADFGLFVQNWLNCGLVPECITQ